MTVAGHVNALAFTKMSFNVAGHGHALAQSSDAPTLQRIKRCQLGRAELRQ